ncbi:hypothetical protein [Xanthomonas fragariae]|uniref:hypothetical protein n=2 Tax=Xanthomonas fragariae TaxID=48664 RepID=UPI00353129D8
MRARMVGLYQDGELDMDRYNPRKKIGSSVMDADLTDNTLPSVGYEYQKKSAGVRNHCRNARNESMVSIDWSAILNGAISVR